MAIFNFASLYGLLARVGFGQKLSPSESESVHRAVQKVHSEFGLLRFQLGAMLLAVKRQELWKGRALSFAGYLEEEKIKPSAANQYMRVAEKLMMELQLDESQLTALSRTSMSTLVKACDQMNGENIAEMLSQLETLSDRDARHILDNIESNVVPLHRQQPPNPKINKLAREYFEMPNDLRIEFIRRIHGNGEQNNNTHTLQRK